MKHIRLALSALTIAALAAGCSSVKLDEKTTDVPVESRSPIGGAQGSAGAGQGTAQSQVATVNVAPAVASGAARIVYFDFDSFVVKDEFRPVIETHAKRMAANRSQKGMIEGHTDERGGREYNLALGQKRAEAVLRSMTLLGVTDSQLEAVSFGKERPAAPGSDEAAWAKNRRAELKDR
ncbi:MAG: peptidoglycan-associated lipoprotein Pal [Pseudomonadota bacterium]